MQTKCSLVSFGTGADFYYAIVGKNGMGIYDDYKERTKASHYLYKPRYQTFDNMEDAMDFVEKNYANMNHFVSCHPKRGYKINWTCYPREITSYKR